MAEPQPDTTPPRRGLAAGVRETWGRLPRERRYLLVGAGVVVLGVLAFLVASGGSGADWRPVARGLQPDDIQTVQTRLDDKKIAYQLGEGGSILVPADKIHEARLELAVSTMPSGKAVGFELFDESGMGRSSFTEKVNLHRALEGELARTIRHIEGIERARVHLVTPERRVFRSLDVEPSASVVLSLAAGHSLSPKQAQAIRQLVAGAVERLQPNKVAIVDQHGTMLARPDSGALGAAGDGYEQQHEREQQLERRVVELLEPVVGAGKVQARVALTMDFSQVVETREDFDPDQQVVRSERETLDRNADPQTAAAGAPGTATNLPGRQGPRAAAPAGAGREKSDTTRNYEIDKVTTRTERPLPRLQRMSVAVLVDDAPDGKGGTTPRTKDELDRYTRLVSGAVGIDGQRGDKIEVVSVPFAAPDVGDTATPGGDPTAGDTSKGDDLLPILVGGIGAAIVLALLIAFGLGGRRRRDAAAAGRALAVAEPPPTPLPPPAAKTEVDAVARRHRIAELRERAVTLGHEDIHRLTVIFERWFDDERRLEAERERTRAEPPKQEAA
ncbi:MAG: flagellar M-ring protein FliF [Deltaproteobacteria bacterium]|nr:flagellar M-ring protein FliF [Deltaproteobacteria bacterium]